MSVVVKCSLCWELLFNSPSFLFQYKHAWVSFNFPCSSWSSAVRGGRTYTHNAFCQCHSYCTCLSCVMVFLVYQCHKWRNSFFVCVGKCFLSIGDKKNLAKIKWYIVCTCTVHCTCICINTHNIAFAPYSCYIHYVDLFCPTKLSLFRSPILKNKNKMLEVGLRVGVLCLVNIRTKIKWAKLNFSLKHENLPTWNEPIVWYIHSHGICAISNLLCAIVCRFLSCLSWHLH